MPVKTIRKPLFAAMLALATLVAGARTALAGGDWNDDGVAWRPYEAGLQEAKGKNKPICLVFYTDWCPHCTNYSRVFHDPRIVEKSKSFVMIRLNKDQNAELSKRYSPDGEYIPRTYFLGSDGTLNESITEKRPNYKYFYSEKEPSSLLRGMDAALSAFATATPQT
jgi:protein-disulfide reductase (glutathione)